MALDRMAAARRQLAGHLGRRAQRWARRRQGVDPPRLRLSSRRIYILPTPAGAMFALLVVTMLAGAMNYNNNLGFALAFLLAGLGIATILHTHRCLAGLQLQYAGAEPVFAGAPLTVRIALINDALLARDELLLSWIDAEERVAGSVPAQDSRTVQLPLTTRRRGPLALPAMRIATRAPLGLLQAWAWIHLDAAPLVWPRPADHNPRRFGAQAHRAEDRLHHPGDDDLAGLRDYQPGDSPRRIAWKSVARSGQLLVRDYRGGDSHEPLWVDWDAIAGDTEHRIAVLTRMVLDESGAGHAWGLRIPGACIHPASGRGHLHRCLQALAMAALPAADST